MHRARPVCRVAAFDKLPLWLKFADLQLNERFAHLTTAQTGRR
jgi:hypothetical protein